MIERTLVDRVFESVLAMDLDVLDGSRSTLEEVVGQMADGYRSMLYEVVSIPSEMLRSGVQVCSYLPLHFKRILLTILTCPPHI